MQWHFMKLASQAKVKLLEPLFDSDKLSDIISADNLKTAKGYNNITIILLALFVPWDYLYSLFADMGTTNDNYSLFY